MKVRRYIKVTEKKFTSAVSVVAVASLSYLSSITSNAVKLIEPPRLISPIL